jgi:hypothetical protein
VKTSKNKGLAGPDAATTLQNVHARLWKAHNMQPCQLAPGVGWSIASNREIRIDYEGFEARIRNRRGLARVELGFFVRAMGKRSTIFSTVRWARNLTLPASSGAAGRA